METTHIITAVIAALAHEHILSEDEVTRDCNGILRVIPAEDMDKEEIDKINLALNRTRRELFPTIREIVADAHASRKELKPNPEGYEGLITEIRPQGFATERECLLVQMVVPGHKPGWFRWNTATEKTAAYEFGRQILSELSPELHKELALRDQLNTRVFVHTTAGYPNLKALEGTKVRVIVKEGNPDPKNGGRFPNEFVPSPIEHQPLREEDALAILAAQAKAANTDTVEVEADPFA